MLEAFLWGLLASASLVLGAGLAWAFNIKQRLLGLIMAFGVGVLISAVAFELVNEAFEAYTSVSNGWPVAAGLVAGALVFLGGDILLDHWARRGKSSESEQEASGLAILLATVLDGIPESIVIGLTLVSGGAVSAALVVAVFLSNLPEAIAATATLKASGWKRGRVAGLWLAVAILLSGASMIGYALFDTANPETVAFTMAFAGGALLTMLADSMMPQAYRDSGKLVGLVTTLGFGLAFFIGTL